MQRAKQGINMKAYGIIMKHAGAPLAPVVGGVPEAEKEQAEEKADEE